MLASHQRAIRVLTATLAAIALGATPALAGEDDDGDDDDSPVIVQQAPPVAETSGSGSGSVIPRGGVNTGFGGTAADEGPDALELGLSGLTVGIGGAGLILLAIRGGGFAVAARRVS